jgi:hypothetical protein
MLEGTRQVPGKKTFSTTFLTANSSCRVLGTKPDSRCQYQARNIMKSGSIYVFIENERGASYSDKLILLSYTISHFRHVILYNSEESISSLV